MQLSHQVFIKITAVPAIKQETGEYYIGIWLCSGKKICYALYPEVEKIITICSCKKCI